MRWVWLLGLLAGCDSFFTVTGQITRCSDHGPLVGASIALTSSNAAATAYSDPDGTFSVVLNAPASDMGLLDVEKPGYVGIQRSVDGSSTDPIDLCLDGLD